MSDSTALVKQYTDQLEQSFSFFLKEIWRLQRLPEPSRVQYDVARWLEAGPQRRGIRGFRGLSKTWITCAYILWRLYRDANERVLLVSKSVGHSRKSMHLIRLWLANIPFLRHLAPRPGTRDRDSIDNLDVGTADWDRTPSITAMGILGQLPGVRATLIVPDDVETMENTQSRDQRLVLRERIEEFEFILVPGGDIIFLGTPHHEDSLYDHLAANKYAFRTWPVQYPEHDQRVPSLAPMLQRDLRDGAAKPTDPVWPERFSRDHIMSLAVSRSTFLMQYMLVSDLATTHRYPLRLADFIVYPAHRDKAPMTIAWGKHTSRGSTAIEEIPSVGFGSDRFYGPVMVDDTWVKYQGVKGFIDPAGRGPDEMSLAIMGQLHGYLYLKHVDGVHGGATTENLHKFVAALRNHRCTEVYIETNFGGDMLIKLIEPILAEYACAPGQEDDCPEGWGCYAIGCHATGQKELRIIGILEPVLNQHRMVISPEVAADTTFTYQLTRLTRDRNSLDHDDRIEAVAGVTLQFQDCLDQDPAKAADRRRERDADEELQRELAEFAGNTAGPTWIRH